MDPVSLVAYPVIDWSRDEIPVRVDLSRDEETIRPTEDIKPFVKWEATAKEYAEEVDQTHLYGAIAALIIIIIILLVKRK